jgi:hypothetical protein
MDKYAISVRKLALRLVEPESKSDYRGAVRAWMSGTRTIDAENAFALGEALGELSDKWISGPLAVVIAGHYYDFMLLLQKMLVRSMGDGDKEQLYWMRFELAHWAVSYIPLLAESELFEADGYSLSAQTDIDAYRAIERDWSSEYIPRRKRFFLRHLRHGRRAFANMGTSDSLPYISEAWKHRKDPPDFSLDLLRQSADMIDAVEMMSRLASANPEAMWRASRSIMWEWAALVDEDFYRSRREEIMAIDALFEVRLLNAAAPALS